jgi:hypothetical protein
MVKLIRTLNSRISITFKKAVLKMTDRHSNLHIFPLVTTDRGRILRMMHSLQVPSRTDANYYFPTCTGGVAA